MIGLAQVGALVVRQRSATRIELGLARSTRFAGAITCLLGAALAMARSSAAISVLAGLVVGLGLLLLAMRRTVVVDLTDGVVTVAEGFGALAARRVVPLFHVRGILISGGRRGYVAVLQLRVGEPIRLDDDPRPARLLAMAEALAEVTAWRTIFRAA